jgi:thiol-disulfide isomerase/thioredoxin
MIIRALIYFLIFISIFLIGACTEQEGSNSNSTFREEFVKKIELIDETGFKNLIQNRDDKILVVNVWATWCIPCREEFPALVKIANKYQNENVEVVGISADYPDEIESKVQPFLESQKAGFKNYVKNFEDDDAFINSVNPEWGGALPATFVYDIDGNLQESHFGQNDFAGFQELIEKAQESKTKSLP